MNSYMGGLVAFLALCVISVIAAPARDDDSAQEYLRYIKKSVDDLKENFETMMKLGNDEISFHDMAKRQGAWDMDYGWGGGRFGKRNTNANNQQGGAKRYDMYGMTGRFGRDVSRVQAQLHSNEHQ